MTRIIFTVFLVTSLIPSGVICKKIFREIVPSRPFLKNPLKRVSITSRTFSFILSVGSFGSLWLLHRFSFLHMLVGMTAFLSGWQISVIGLTGGIATGKSTASRFLKEHIGCVVIDADKIAHDCLKKGTIAHRQIVKTFGPQVVDDRNGEINRSALGALIFSNKQQRIKLERITHPWILLRMLGLVIANRVFGKEVVLDVPLLFEQKTFPLLYLLCSETVFIDLEYKEQMERLQLRNPELSESDISSRINSQLSREEKLALADYVISNRGTISDLERNIKLLFRFA